MGFECLLSSSWVLKLPKRPLIDDIGVTRIIE